MRRMRRISKYLKMKGQMGTPEGVACKKGNESSGV